MSEDELENFFIELLKNFSEKDKDIIIQELEVILNGLLIT